MPAVRSAALFALARLWMLGDSVGMDTMFERLSDASPIISFSLLVLLLLWETAAPFFAFFSGKTRARALHALRNMLLTLLNAVLVSTLFVGLWAMATSWAQAHDVGLLHNVALPTWCEAALAVLLLDVWTYWWHRANHRIGFLWRFHRVHHSDNHMDVTTANRFHVGEITMSSMLRIPVLLLIGCEMWHLALYELIMFPVVQFHHANIGVPAKLDRALRTIIVTPIMHKVHHSHLQPETDSNYTSLLSVWDRLFSSFRLPEDAHRIQLGLDNYEDESCQSLIGLLVTPFKSR